MKSLMLILLTKVRYVASQGTGRVKVCQLAERKIGRFGTSEKNLTTLIQHQNCLSQRIIFRGSRQYLIFFNIWQELNLETFELRGRNFIQLATERNKAPRNTLLRYDSTKGSSTIWKLFLKNYQDPHNITP